MKDEPASAFDAACHARSKDIIDRWRTEDNIKKSGYVCQPGKKREFDTVCLVESQDSEEPSDSAASSQSDRDSVFTSSSSSASLSSSKKRKTGGKVSKGKGKASFPYHSDEEEDADKSDKNEEKCDYEVDDE